MAQERFIEPLTDDELLAVADDPELSLKFTSEERRRLTRLRTTTEEPAARSWTDTAVDTLPTIGGAVGGIMGGIGGTAFGLGVGGVPGAIGGATLGGGAGEAARQLINRARGAETPDTSLEAATGIGLQGGIQGALEVGGAGITKLAGSAARGVYRGYLKPSLAAKNLAKARQVVKTAIDEALPISRAGATVDATGRLAGKAGRIVGELHREVDDILNTTQEAVDLVRVAQKIRVFAKRKYYKPGADLSDYKAALDVADRIDRHPSLRLPPGARPSRVDVSLPQANEVKRSLQSAARSSYGTPNAAAKEEAEKLGGSLIRRAIEGKTGGTSGRVATLNARESRILDSGRSIAQAVEREANQNPLYGMKTIASGALGAGAATGGLGAPGAAALALATRVALHPAVASRAAILADRLAGTLGVSASLAARLSVQILVTEKHGPEEPQGDVQGAQ